VVDLKVVKVVVVEVEVSVVFIDKVVKYLMLQVVLCDPEA